MRDDVGLIGWRQHHAIGQARQDIADLKFECDVDTEDPLTVLCEWAVRPTETDDVPTSLEQYRVANFPGTFPHDGPAPQGFAVKYRDHPWRLGIMKDLSPAVETEVLKDAIRIITGHIHGYDAKHAPETTEPQGGDGVNGVAFVWRRVTVEEPDTPPSDLPVKGC